MDKIIEQISLEDYVRLKRITLNKENLGVSFQTFINICHGGYKYNKYEGRREYMPSERSLQALSSTLGITREELDKLISNGLK